MLNGALMITRYRNGKTFPLRLSLEKPYFELAATLIDFFEQLQGQTRETIEEELKTQGDDGTNPKIVAGLGKLLLDRSEFSAGSEENYWERRKTVFQTAANYWKKEVENTTDFCFHWQKILHRSGLEERPKDKDGIPSFLFGDLPANQFLREFPLTTPEKLIHLYNCSQVQGLLIHAESLTLTIQRIREQSLRQVMQFMRFFRLLFLFEVTEQDQCILHIDGPGSILENGKSYGIELANFFPAILLLKDSWTMKAIIRPPRKKESYVLEIDEKDAYQSPYKRTGVWFQDKITRLVERFNDQYQGVYEAVLENEIIPLAENRYLLPDFSVYSVSKKNKTPTSRKKSWKIEWIRYLTNDKIEWMKKTVSHLPKGYFWAVKGRKQHLGKLAEELSPHLILFNTELTSPAVKKAIESKQMLIDGQNKT